MRNLLILVGNQGQGKSSWVRDNNLEDFTISMDNIRLLFKHPTCLPNGKITTNEIVNSEVANIFKTTLRYRMSEGAFTVVDCMNTKESDFKIYKAFAAKYGYRLWVKDFRNNKSLEECIAVNDIRPTKWIPELAIETHFEVQKLLKFNSSITVINKLSEIPNSHDIKFFNKNDYQNIYYIGDIHGCFSELETFLKHYYTLNDYYVFTGDYIDRGPDSVSVLKKLSEIYDNGNVCLIEGNHEKWLRYWAASNDDDIRSKEFKDSTLGQFSRVIDESRGTLAFTRKDAKSFVRKMSVYSSISFYGKKIFACHGGVPRIDKCHSAYSQLAAANYISGSGNYSDLNAMYETDPKGLDYIIHGHRNKGDKFFCNKYINLEGSVEAGGKLKIARFDCDEVFPITINSTFNYYNNGKTAVQELRDSPHVKETILNHHLASFNFTRELFQKKSWNKTTIRARGLFVNTTDDTVMARSYEKFFNMNELPETEEGALRDLKYPIVSYEKSNGFLGITSHDKVLNDLLIASKSTTKGEYAILFSDILDEFVDMTLLNQYCKDRDVSVVFEVMDPVVDPHIIKYESKKLILLDIIENSYVFKKSSYEELKKLRDLIRLTQSNNFRVKHLVSTYDTFEQMKSHFLENKESNIEGFVCEDSNGFMFKYKNSYYSVIKLYRNYWDICRKSEGTVHFNKLISELNAKGYLFESGSEWAIIPKLEAIKVASFIKTNFAKYNDIISLHEAYKSHSNEKIH